MRQAFSEFEIWDERDQDRFNRAQLEVNSRREFTLKKVFSAFLIPRINRHFMGWQIARAFTIEHTTLKFRLADEFELLEAPDVMALSTKTKIDASSKIAESANIDESA